MPKLNDYIPQMEEGGRFGDFISNYAWMPFGNNSKFTTGNMLWNFSGFIYNFIDQIRKTSNYYGDFRNASRPVFIGPARKGIVLVCCFATWLQIEQGEIIELAFISDKFKLSEQNAIKKIFRTVLSYSDILKSSINVPAFPKVISSKWIVDTSRFLLSKTKIKGPTTLIAYTPEGIATASCMCLLIYKENGIPSQLSFVEIKKDGSEALEFSPKIIEGNDVLLINTEIHNHVLTGILDPKYHHLIMDDSVREASSLLDISLLLRRNGVDKRKISTIVIFNHSEYGPIQASNLDGIPVFSMTSSKSLIEAKHSDNKSINYDAYKMISKEYYWKRYNAKTRAKLIELGVLLNEGRTCLVLKRLIYKIKKQDDFFWWSLYSECLRILACKLYMLGSQRLIHANFKITPHDMLALGVSLLKRIGMLEMCSYLNGGNLIINNSWMNGKNLSNKISKAFFETQRHLSKISLDNQIEWACKLRLSEKKYFLNSSLNDFISCICRGNILSQAALQGSAYALVNINANDPEIIIQHAINHWVVGEYPKCISILQKLVIDKNNSTANELLDYIIEGKNFNPTTCLIGIRKSGKYMVHYDWQ